MLGTCKLCHQTRELRNSHVIPELCYLAAYDPLHRAQKFEAEPNRRRLIQKGLREYLLCDDCEGRLSRLEHEFKQFWYATPAALPSPVPLGSVSVRGFAYASFKLLHLSIFWRASVASSPDFNTVALGPHEDKIRLMLLNDDPGLEEHYPMFGQVLVDGGGTVAYGLVGKPQVSEHDGQQAYYASYAGVEWFLIVTDDPPSAAIKPLLPYVPRQNGEMILNRTPVEQSNTVRIFASQFLDDATKEL